MKNPKSKQIRWIHMSPLKSLPRLAKRIGVGGIWVKHDSQVLLINTEGNTSPDEFRSGVWEGSIPVPEEYKIHAKEDQE